MTGTAAGPGRDEWFVPLAAGDQTSVPLFIFPHAGAGPASLAGLAAEFGPTVRPWALNLPGRQARRHELPCTDLDALADSLAAAIGARPRGPFALFGYCAGALTAYLVASRLDGMGRRPVRLFVASAAAPDLAAVPRTLHRLPSERFWAEVLAQGGIPPELARHAELRPVFEPALRADFALLAGYRHAAADPRPFGITVLHGRSDSSLGRGALFGWRRQTRQPLGMRELPGTHWLLDSSPRELAQAISDEIEAAAR